nr:hypothetical protein CFP56_73149 [Quercus suber]
MYQECYVVGREYKAERDMLKTRKIRTTGKQAASERGFVVSTPEVLESRWSEREGKLQQKTANGVQRHKLRYWRMQLAIVEQYCLMHCIGTMTSPAAPLAPSSMPYAVRVMSFPLIFQLFPKLHRLTIGRWRMLSMIKCDSERHKCF